MRHHQFIARGVAAGLSMSIASIAGAGAIEYTDRPTWEAAVGPFSTIDFTEFAVGTFVTTQYPGVEFTDGNDEIIANGAFVLDGFGLDAHGDTTLVFDLNQFYFGVDFPGAVQIDLFLGNVLVYSSSNFAGAGSGFFAGLLSDDPFDTVVLRDWVDALAFFDNMSYVVPTPGALALLGVAGLLGARRRRRP